jgi:hypothetical protein
VLHCAGLAGTIIIMDICFVFKLSAPLSVILHSHYAMTIHCQLADFLGKTYFAHKSQITL